MEVMEDAHINKDIVEENISDWKTFDVFTFLLVIIYLNETSSQLPVKEMLKEYFKEFKGDKADKNVQKLLMYMYQQRYIDKRSAESLLQGTYKKLVITNASLNMSFTDDLEFDEDNSKILSTGESLRSVLRSDLRI